MRALIIMLVSLALLLTGVFRLEAQDKSLHEPAFKPILRVMVQNATLRVHSDGPSFLITYGDGRLVSDPALGEPAVLAALIHRHWCRQSELDAFANYQREIKKFLAVEAAAQAALTVRGAATHALVDMSVTYLSADPSQLTRDVVLRQLKSTAKGALKDSLVKMAQNPDAYLRLLAANILNSTSRDLGVLAGNCRIYRSAAIPVEELKLFDDLARKNLRQGGSGPGFDAGLAPRGGCMEPAERRFGRHE